MPKKLPTTPRRSIWSRSSTVFVCIIFPALSHLLEERGFWHDAPTSESVGTVPASVCYSSSAKRSLEQALVSYSNSPMWSAGKTLPHWIHLVMLSNSNWPRSCFRHPNLAAVPACCCRLSIQSRFWLSLREYKQTQTQTRVVRGIETNCKQRRDRPHVPIDAL
jgi:hypothetical protein